MKTLEEKYEIQFTPDAAADMKELDGSIKIQLKKILTRKLACAPEQFGSPLGGILAGYWSHHFAAHRVIYRVYKEAKLVVICAVGSRRGVHASDVYQQLQGLAQAGRLAEQIRNVLDSLGISPKSPQDNPREKKKPQNP